MEEMKISAMLVCLNEERYIEAYINNLLDKVEEIVIVDTGSTDKTIEIIEQYREKTLGVDIKLYKWNRVGRPYSNDWKESECRNFAISKCTGDWILWQDADELVSDNFRSEVNKIKELDQYGYIVLPFIPLWKDFYHVRINMPNDMRWYPNRLVRFFNNHLGITFDKKNHHCTLKLIGEFRTLEKVQQIHYHYATIPLKKFDNRGGDVGIGYEDTATYDNPNWEFNTLSVDGCDYEVRYIPFQRLGILHPKAAKFYKDWK